METIQELIKKYHVVIEDIESWRAEWFILYSENGAFSVNTLSSLAAKIAQWEETMWDLTNQSVFIQYNWAWHIALETREFVWPSWIKYRSPSFNYSKLLPTWAYWYWKTVDTTSQPWEIRIWPVAKEIEPSLDPDDIISAHSICWDQLFVWLQNKPIIYKYVWNWVSWDFNTIDTIDLSKINPDIRWVIFIDYYCSDNWWFISVVARTETWRVWYIINVGTDYWVEDEIWYAYWTSHIRETLSIPSDEIEVKTRASRNYQANDWLACVKEFNDWNYDRYVLELWSDWQECNDYVLPWDKITAYNANWDIIEYTLSWHSGTFYLSNYDVYAVAWWKLQIEKPYPTDDDDVEVQNWPIAYIKISDNSLKQQVITNYDNPKLRCFMPFDVYDSDWNLVWQYKSVIYTYNWWYRWIYVDWNRVPASDVSGSFDSWTLYIWPSKPEWKSWIRFKDDTFPIDTSEKTYYLKKPKYIYRQLPISDSTIAVYIVWDQNTSWYDLNILTIEEWYFWKCTNTLLNDYRVRRNPFAFSWYVDYEDRRLYVRKKYYWFKAQYNNWWVYNDSVKVQLDWWIQVFFPTKNNISADSCWLYQVYTDNGNPNSSWNFTTDEIELDQSKYIYWLDYLNWFVLWVWNDTGWVYKIYYNWWWNVSYKYLTADKEWFNLVWAWVMWWKYYIPNPNDLLLYEYDYTTDISKEVASIAVDSTPLLYFPTVFALWEILIIESNIYKTFYYQKWEFWDSWYLVSSIYWWYLWWVNKVWTYARVRLNKQYQDYWQKIRLAISYDWWKTFYYLPRKIWLPFIEDNFYWYVPPEYEYTFSDLKDWELAPFYFPYWFKSTHIAYKVEMYRWDAPIKDFVVKIVDLYYVVDTASEFYINLSLLLNPRQQLINWQIETPWTRHLEKLEFLKDIYKNKKIVKLYYPWWESIYCIPYETQQSWWFGITTIDIEWAKKNFNEFSFLVRMTLKWLSDDSFSPDNI